MTQTSQQGAAAGGRHRTLWIALGFSLLQGVLLAHTAWDKSDTADEPYYLASAVEQWNEGNFAETCDAPALPKWGFAAALHASDPALFDPTSKQGTHPLWSRPLPQTRVNLLAGRLATIVVTVGGGLLLWSAARRFGDAAACVSHALWCLSPTVLAQGSLATLDAWVTALLCAVALAVIRVVEAPTLARAALVGAALAAAAACKVTALAAAPVVLIVMGWALVRQSRAALLPGVTAAAAAFLLTLWAVYGFRIGSVNPQHLCGRDTGLAAAHYGPLPFAPWIEGLLLQWLHGSSGHLSYLFGHSSGLGWWWFYLAALGLKTTLGAQLLAVVLLVATLKTRSGRAVDVALLAFPVLLVIAMSVGKAQNGIRYVLPAFPCAMLWAGSAFTRLTPALGSTARALALAALAAGGLESLARHPHHLMFFNLWAGGPSGGPRYLVHGDDWGQDQRRLGEWQRSHPGRLYYTYYNGQPRHWTIDYDDVACEPRPGFYALHAVEVHRPKRLPAGCLDWLTVEPPDDRLGYSIYVYQVNKQRIERLTRERLTLTPFWKSGP